MSRWLIVLALAASACVDPKVPAYVLTPPTAPTPVPTPPTPPPSTPVQPLTVTLSVGPSEPYEGNLAAFTASVTPSSMATGYAWSFGDGVTRETAEGLTRYSYARAGTYEASVTVTDTLGRTASHGTRVQVRTIPAPPPPPPTPPPVAPTLSADLTCTPKASPTPTPCNVTVAYGGTTLPSASVRQVDWDWGDGVTQTVVPPQNPPTATHGYQQPGSFTIFAVVRADTVDGSKTTMTSLAVVIP